MKERPRPLLAENKHFKINNEYLLAISIGLFSDAKEAPTRDWGEGCGGGGEARFSKME